MKATLTFGLLLATAPIYAKICSDGASVYTRIKAARLVVGMVSCEGLPGVFTGREFPENPKDPAEMYCRQILAYVNCNGDRPCIATCEIDLTENPLDSLATLLWKNKRSCEAAGGTYTSPI